MQHVAYWRTTGIRHHHKTFICHYYLAPRVRVLFRQFFETCPGRGCMPTSSVCVMGLYRPCNSPLIHLRAYLHYSEFLKSSLNRNRLNVYGNWRRSRRFLLDGYKISKSTSPSWCNIFIMQTGAPNSLLRVTSGVDSSEVHIRIESVLTCLNVNKIAV